MNRVILIVLDSVGIGELPDANLYNDLGANTLGHIFERYPQIKTPNLIALGLGNIVPDNIIPKTNKPLSAFGKAAEVSAGKDTTTGHWEIAGVTLEKPFPTFTETGFPNEFIQKFEEKIGIKTIGNISASGTEIIDNLGEEHIKTGFPIVYTSADSVFQIAMHEGIIPIKKQYEICKIAREMLVDDLEVGRVIARPFEGTPGNFQRTSRRKDYATLPPHTILDALTANDISVHAVGKIWDIFAEKGISSHVKTANNNEGMQQTLTALEQMKSGLIFTNLVDFDMHFGHRRDVEGYAKAIEAFDEFLPKLMTALKPDDLVIITADHGNDPTHHGTDHTREYIPILNVGEKIKKGENIGTRSTFADIAATIADAFGIDFSTNGVSYLPQILN